MTGEPRKREQFGRGKLAVDPANSVFINCPFDADFEAAFDAIFFAVVCSGYCPRSALETGSVGVPRLDRIASGIFGSKYSIHDLSRCRGEGTEQLARFNMPLELGMAMARAFAPGSSKRLRHEWLVMVPEGHVYLKFISDLAAYDPVRHDGTGESIVPQVMSWLATRDDAVEAPPAYRVVEELPAYRARKALLQGQWKGHVPWADLVLAARDASRRLTEDGWALGRPAGAPAP